MNKYLIIFRYINDGFDCPDYITDMLVVEEVDEHKAKEYALRWFHTTWGRTFESYNDSFKDTMSVEIVSFDKLNHDWAAS